MVRNNNLGALLADAFEAIFSLGILSKPDSPWKNHVYKNMSRNASSVPQRAAWMMNTSWRTTTQALREDLKKVEEKHDKKNSNR